MRVGRWLLGGILACGAANSAALLLRSANGKHDRGLGNSSDLLGRNYMVHNSTFLLAIDPRLGAAESAADQLEAEGIKVTVWDVRVVSNPDPAMLADAAGHRVVITAEDGFRQGGGGMFVADALRSTAPYGTTPPVISLGTPRSYIPQGKPDQILAQLGLDGPGLAHTVRAAVRGSSGQYPEPLADIATAGRTPAASPARGVSSI